MSYNQVAIYRETELQRYLSEVSKINILSEKEELDLTLDFYHNRNIESAHKLIVSHIPLVVKIAYSYKGYGIPIMDLISEGNIGLMKAVAKFDPAKGFRLSTYAMWWIKAYITDYILNSWSMVKSTTLTARKKLFFSLNKIKEKLGINSLSITDGDAIKISNHLGMNKKDVIDVNNMIYSRDVYLQANINNDEDSITLEELIKDSSETPEEEYIEKEQTYTIKENIKKVFSLLNDREKEILTKRYMLNKPLSLEAIGNQLNISRERVRQIEVSSLAKARKFLLSEKKSNNLISSH